MPKTHPIHKACKIINTTLEGLGAILGVTKSAVHQWTNPDRDVPVEHCFAIEQATGGKVTRRDLRPNDWQKIWPELSDAA